jgi:transcriptional regulator with XRE-family HTH domain
MSQEDLALACGLDRTYIGGIERGERNVGVLNLARIARAIGISISDLLSDVR